MVQWRKRKVGTPRQRGQAFPVEDESPQKKRSALSKVMGHLSGGDRSMREKKFIEGMKQMLKSKDQKLLDESEILTPNDVKVLCDRGLLEINDDDEIAITLKGYKYLMDLRKKEHPQEGVPKPRRHTNRLTEMYKAGDSDSDEETEDEIA